MDVGILGPQDEVKLKFIVFNRVGRWGDKFTYLLSAYSRHKSVLEEADGPVMPS